MRRQGLLRAAQITGVLAAFGASVGALLGGALVALLGVRLGDFRLDAELLTIGAQFGATTGAVLAPVAAWTLMRRVPLWRAIAETATGTVLGAAIGLVGQPLLQTAWLSPVFLGVAGFALAAIRLRFAPPTGPARPRLMRRPANER